MDNREKFWNEIVTFEKYEKSRRQDEAKVASNAISVVACDFLVNLLAPE